MRATIHSSLYVHKKIKKTWPESVPLDKTRWKESLWRFLLGFRRTCIIQNVLVWMPAAGVGLKSRGTSLHEEKHKHIKILASKRPLFVVLRENDHELPYSQWMSAGGQHRSSNGRMFSKMCIRLFYVSHRSLNTYSANYKHAGSSVTV